jgi:hypothetical protein
MCDDGRSSDALQARRASLEREIATLRSDPADAHTAHGLLADVCDILFADGDRAATHGYEGLLDRARALVGRCALMSAQITALADACDEMQGMFVRFTNPVFQALPMATWTAAAAALRELVGGGEDDPPLPDVGLLASANRMLEQRNRELEAELLAARGGA